MQKGLTGQLGRGQDKGVGSTAQQLRLRDSMLSDLRSQNKALAGASNYLHWCRTFWMSDGLQGL